MDKTIVDTIDNTIDNTVKSPPLQTSTPSSSPIPPKDQHLYTCSSCTTQIPTHLARISCHSCFAYHSCTNCHVIALTVPPHKTTHSVMVFKLSGIVVPPPPGFAPRAPPALPPRSKSVGGMGVGEGGMGEGKVKTWAGVWNVLKKPMEKWEVEKKAMQREKEAEKHVTTGVGGKGDGVMMSGARNTSQTGSLSRSPVVDLPPSPPRSIGEERHQPATTDKKDLDGEVNNRVGKGSGNGFMVNDTKETTSENSTKTTEIPVYSSPIVLGSPAMPLQTKGEERKVEALLHNDDLEVVTETKQEHTVTKHTSASEREEAIVDQTVVDSGEKERRAHT